MVPSFKESSVFGTNYNKRKIILIGSDSCVFSFQQEQKTRIVSVVSKPFTIISAHLFSHFSCLCVFVSLCIDRLGDTVG